MRPFAATGRLSFTCAAAVLCSKNPFAALMHHELRMGRLLANGVGPFLDRRFLAGPAFALLEAAERFCRDHFPRDFPMAALREALVNALVHRDYAKDVPWTTVALFDDRVELWNPGELPRGMSVESLAGTHRTVPRNPTIAAAFRRSGLAEGRGTGTNRMIAMCKAAKVAPPVFEETGGGLMVTFRFAASRRSAARTRSRTV